MIFTWPVDLPRMRELTNLLEHVVAACLDRLETLGELRSLCLLLGFHLSLDAIDVADHLGEHVEILAANSLVNRDVGQVVRDRLRGLGGQFRPRLASILRRLRVLLFLDIGPPPDHLH